MKTLTLVTVTLLIVGCNAPSSEVPRLEDTKQSAPSAPEDSDPDAFVGPVAVECDPAQAPFGGGNGLGETEWAICSPEHLEEMRLYPTAHFILAADIDMTGREYITPGTFKGVFKGNGHAIIGLKIRKNVFNVPGNPSFGDPSFLGLWYQVGMGARVENLTFTALDIEGSNFLGALGGAVNLNAEVTNVVVASGSVTSLNGGIDVGALTGWLGGTLTSCSSQIGALIGVDGGGVIQ
jgi:hypothetical protein